MPNPGSKTQDIEKRMRKTEYRPAIKIVFVFPCQWGFDPFAYDVWFDVVACEVVDSGEDQGADALGGGVPVGGCVVGV